MTTELIWYDGFGRHHEEVTEVSKTAYDKTFKGADGLEFTVHNNQIVKLGNGPLRADDANDDSYADYGDPQDAGDE